MAIEFIGSLVSAGPLASGQLPPAESQLPPGESQDPDYPARIAALQEESGFDRVLIGYSPQAPDALVVANQVLTTTSRVGVLLAHRPGIVAPTVAARQYATLEAFHPGRVAMHVPTGSDEGDHLRDGDGCDSTLRHRRAEEFLTVLRLAWSSAEPFDYAGEFYQVAGGMSAVRPADGSLPVYVDAASDAAVRAAAEHADTFAFQAEPVTRIAGRIAAVRAAASRYGRRPRWAITVRSVAAATEAAAWARAARAGEVAYASVRDGKPGPLLTTRPGAGASPAALVGSYEQVADALLDYVALGVSTLVICADDPEADAADHAIIIRLARERAGCDSCLVA